MGGKLSTITNVDGQKARKCSKVGLFLNVALVCVVINNTKDADDKIWNVYDAR